MRLLIFLLATILAPTFATAEQFGTVSVNLDGEDQEWFTISASSGTKVAATASVRIESRYTDLSIQAHPEPKYSSKRALSLSMMFFGNYEQGKAPASVEVIYLTDGMQNPFYTSDGADDAVSVDVELLETAENPGRVKGSFSAKVCLVSEFYAEPDLTDCKALSGSFDTQVQVR